MRKLLKGNRSFVREIRRALKEHFPAQAIKVYRYNSACIRVRIVDERFEGKTIPERESIVLPLIRKLPEDVQAEITVLLLLPPSEVEQSLMNLEFERATRSQF